MSSSSANGNSKSTSHYEFDSKGVLVQTTQIDGVRTHMKFIYDVGGLSNVQQLVEPADTYSDEYYCETPECSSPVPGGPLHVCPLPDNEDHSLPRSDSFLSHSSVQLGDNHRTLRVSGSATPRFASPTSQVPTEIITHDERMEQLRREAAQEVRPLSRAPTDMSGKTTQLASSFGHAGAQSDYHEYQENGLPTFQCLQPEVSMQAQARIVIQRCDAMERNLSAGSIPQDVRFSSVALSSNDGDDRFVSPCPSGQVVPPSLHSQANTPLLRASDSFKDNVPPSSEVEFDYSGWHWSYDSDTHLKIESMDDEASLTNAVPDSSSRQSSPLTEVDDCEMGVHTENVGIPDCGSERTIHVSGFFSRECSPLTEYDYSATDYEEAEGSSTTICASSIHNVKQLPTPELSPDRDYVHTGIVTRSARAKMHAAALSV